MCLWVYVCDTMDLYNPEVIILKEPVTDLHFFGHCDIIEQSAKTDSLTISGHNGLSTSCVDVSR